MKNFEFLFQLTSFDIKEEHPAHYLAQSLTDTENTFFDIHVHVHRTCIILKRKPRKIKGKFYNCLFCFYFFRDQIKVHIDKRKLNLPYSGISTVKLTFSPGLIVTALTEN